MKLFKKKLKLDPNRPVPSHIAIVLDGNGRWAQKRHLPRTAGHAAGSENFRKIATYCRDIGVKYLTVYAFSTENWKRSEEEINTIMGLLEKYLFEALENTGENIRLNFFGDLSRLTPRLQALAKKVADDSSVHQGFQANICLNYGSRDEIVQAAQLFAKKCMDGTCQPENLTQEDFSGLLYSAQVPDPDLIIRPSGEVRLSNFLLWQSAYSEFYFTDVLWPDFSPQHLEIAIETFNRRNRRFGGIQL